MLCHTSFYTFTTMLLMLFRLKLNNFYFVHVFNFVPHTQKPFSWIKDISFVQSEIAIETDKSDKDQTIFLDIRYVSALASKGRCFPFKGNIPFSFPLYAYWENSVNNSYNFCCCLEKYPLISSVSEVSYQTIYFNVNVFQQITF